MVWIVPPQNLVEPVQAPVVWIESTGALALSEGIVTRYWCAQRDLLEGDGARSIELIVKQPLRHAIDDILKHDAELIGAVLAQRGWPPPGDGGFRPRLVKG